MSFPTTFLLLRVATIVVVSFSSLIDLRTLCLAAPAPMVSKSFSSLIGWHFRNELVFMSISAKQHVFLLNLNISLDSQMLVHPDGIKNHCIFGAGHSYNHSQISETYKLKIHCLYDNRISTPYHYMIMQAVACEYPPFHLIGELTGRPVTLVVNGKKANSVANFTGLPCFSPKIPTAPPLPGFSLSNSISSAKVEDSLPPLRKYKLCACLGMYYRSDLLERWLHHHTAIGLEFTLLYDNDSGIDRFEEAYEFLSGEYNLRRIEWMHDKSQYAMNVHCMLELEDTCDWVMAIDVDEYLNLGPGIKHLGPVLDKSKNLGGGEVLSYNFYPSGHIDVNPDGGFIKNYNCRAKIYHTMTKSIVQPSLLHPSRLHVVHYFCYLPGYNPYAKFPEALVRLHHYQFPSWPIYKRKYVKRFATPKIIEGPNTEENLKSRYVKEYGGQCDVSDWRLKDDFECRFTLKHNSVCPPLVSPYPAHSTLFTGVGDGALRALSSLFSRLTSPPHPNITTDFAWTFGNIQSEDFDIGGSTYSRVVHVVEHPLLSIRHIMKTYSEADWEFVEMRTPLVKRSYPLMKKALYHWVTWNQWIENYSDERISLSTANLNEVCQRAGYSTEACGHLPSRVRAKCPPPPSANDLDSPQSISDPSYIPRVVLWHMLDEADSYVGSLARNMTAQYNLPLLPC